MRTCENCKLLKIKDDAEAYVKLCLDCYRAGKKSKTAEAGSPKNNDAPASRKDDQIARMCALNNATKLAELYVLTKQWKEISLEDLYDLAQQLKHYVDTGEVGTK